MVDITKVRAIDIHTHAEEPCGCHADDGGTGHCGNRAGGKRGGQHLALEPDVENARTFGKKPGKTGEQQRRCAADKCRHRQMAASLRKRPVQTHLLR